MKIEILTDDYPQETLWNLYDLNFAETVPIATGGPYSEPNEIYSTNVSLCSGFHRFCITDQSNDGMCCSYGSGYYIVYYDETVMIEGAQFSDKECFTFGCTSNDDCDDRDCSVGTCQNGSCKYEIQNGIEARVELKTDNYPSDTTWDIFDLALAILLG